MQPHMYLKNKYTRMHGRMHSAFACLQKCVHRKHTKGVKFSIVALLCKSLVIRKKPAKGPVGLFFVGGGAVYLYGYVQGLLQSQYMYSRDSARHANLQL